MDYILGLIHKIITDFGLNKFNFVQFYLIFCTVVISLLIELFIVGYKESSLKKIIKPQNNFADHISFLIESLNLFGFISFIFCFGIFYKITGYLQMNYHYKFIGLIENKYLIFIIVYVLNDLKSYWRHLLFHKVNFLWQLHSFHHSAENFNILNRYRGHFLEGAISVLFDVFPFILIGTPIETFLLVKFISEIHQQLVHSNINSSWGFIGKYILVSPLYHKIHHSIDERHFNKNFGVTFVFWDKIFKTSILEKKITHVGVPHSYFNKKGYFYDIFKSTTLFLKHFMQTILFIKKTNIKA